MRRAAGYGADRDGLGVADLLGALPIPNLPGHRALENQDRERPKPKTQTLRYIRGYPIVEDSVSACLVMLHMLHGGVCAHTNLNTKLCPCL